MRLLVHAEVGNPGNHQVVQLNKRPRVEKKVDPFPCRELSGRVLLIDTGLTAAETRCFPPSCDFVDLGPFLIGVRLI